MKKYAFWNGSPDADDYTDKRITHIEKMADKDCMIITIQNSIDIEELAEDLDAEYAELIIEVAGPCGSEIVNFYDFSNETGEPLYSSIDGLFWALGADKITREINL